MLFPPQKKPPMIHQYCWFVFFQNICVLCVWFEKIETVENILVGLSLQFSCLIFLKGYHGKMFNWFPSRKKKKSKPVCVCVLEYLRHFLFYFLLLSKNRGGNIFILQIFFKTIYLFNVDLKDIYQECSLCQACLRYIYQENLNQIRNHF